MSKRDLSPDSLEAQADALLAAADSMDIPDEIPMPGKSSRSGKAAKAARPEADHIMTDEEAKKAGIVRLDDKQVAALPAASWLMGQEKLRELEEKIMTVKHALNLFNTTHTVPGFSMTIDRALVYLPFLSARVKKLGEMKARLPKAREKHDRYDGYGNLVDYRHINYDRLEAAKDYDTAFDELCRLQTALDAANNTEKFEIDL